MNLEREKDPETLRQAALILDRENAKLIAENLRLQRENERLKGLPPEALALKLQLLEEQLGKARQELFGPSSTRYPRYYRPDPASRSHVQHLRFWYAQSHPDEDFAETFAVWLTPRANWRRRYFGWPAMKKLQYVDELMADVAAEKPDVKRRIKVEPLSRLTHTLAEHYEKKHAYFAADSHKTYDRDLRRIFSDDPKHRHAPAASTFLIENRAEISRTVSRWTGEYQPTLDAIFNDMIARCRLLKLRAVGPERQLRMDFTVLLTAKTVHSLYSPSRRQWFAL